jgi:hypothetical protein
MPSGIYKRTAIARFNIGNAHRGLVGYWAGKKRSEEDKNKMRLAKIGKKQSKEHIEKRRLKCIGNKSRRGQHLSDITKKKMSEMRKGPKHWNWRGGISTENTKVRLGIEYDLWRSAVYSRDSYTDQYTGVRGGDLVAHHILNFSSHPELRFAIDNGVTLSIEKHKEFHKKYGRKDNTWEQINEFILKSLC